MKKLQISAAFSFVEQKLLLRIYGEGGYEERLRNLDSVYTSLRKKGMSPSDIQSVLREAFRAADEEIASLSAKESATMMDQSEQHLLYVCRSMP